MDITILTPQERQIRANIRNFLLNATEDEWMKELQISHDRKDYFREHCITEIIDEYRARRIGIKSF